MRELTLRSDQISRSVVSDSLRPHELQHRELTQRKPLEYKTRHHPTTSKHPVQDATSKQPTKQKYRPNHHRIPTSLSLAHQRKNKQKNSAQISPCKKLTQTIGPTLGGQKPKGRKNSTLKPGKRRPQTHYAKKKKKRKKNLKSEKLHK